MVGRHAARRGPGIRDGVVGQCFLGESGVIVLQGVGIKEAASVRTAQDQNMTLPDIHGGAGHEAARGIRTLSPALEVWRVFPHITEELNGLALLAPSAHHIHAGIVSVVLADGQVESPRRSGPGR